MKYQVLHAFSTLNTWKWILLLSLIGIYNSFDLKQTRHSIFFGSSFLIDNRNQLRNIVNYSNISVHNLNIPGCAHMIKKATTDSVA